MKHDRLIARRDAAGRRPCLRRRVAALGMFAAELPPTYGSLLRLGDNLTYSAHRALLPGQSLVREYSRADLSSFPAVGTTDPADPNSARASETYRQLQRGGFADWRLSVEGLVSRPAAFSLAELKRLPARTQITKHVCEEGWTRHRRVDGRAAQPRAGRGGPAAGGAIRQRLLVRRHGRQHRPARRAASADAAGLRHERPRPARASRRAAAAARGTADGLQEHEIPTRIVVTEQLDDGGDKGNPKNGWAWYVGILSVVASVSALYVAADRSTRERSTSQTVAGVSEKDA